MLFTEPKIPAKPFKLQIWAAGLVMVGYFAWCWMNLIPYGDELQQFPRAFHTLHPEWIPDDIFVGAPQGDHWLFFRFLAFLFWLAGPIGGAILSRFVIWSLMAAAIVSLGRSLALRLPAILIGVALFIGYDQSRLGGETIVGEAIARHLCYPLILFALSAWIRARFVIAGALLGAAIAVHVLVGAWAAAIILPLMFIDERARSDQRFRFGPAIICILFALPGLIPILPLVHSSELVGSAVADEIFISFRHPHHLQPNSWPLGDYLHFGFMIAAFLLLSRRQAPSVAMTRLRQFAWLMIVVTALGIAFGICVRNAFFLKLHPYRFAPPLMTFFVSLLIAQFMLALGNVRWRSVAVMLVMLVAVWHAPRGAHQFYRDTVTRSELEQGRIDALQWVRRATPAGAVVLANPAWSDIQWQSRRSSVVSFKLVPFEPERVIEWYERLSTIVPQPPWSQLGHEMMRWISRVYESIPQRELVRIAAQLQADVTISHSPCDPHGLIYANEHFCVHSSGKGDACQQNYIVVRYDDYSPISPYEGPARLLATERRLFDIAETHGGKVAVGVIPFAQGQFEGPSRPLDGHFPEATWLSAASDPWVLLLREAVQRGVVEPALHGFEHRRTTRPGFRPGEFRGQGGQWQFEAMRVGRDALASALKHPIRVFIPPWNSWDKHTMSALEHLQFSVLSPDLHHAETQSPSVRIFPQGTADPWQALRIMKESPDPDGTVLVLVLHPFDFERTDGLGEEYFRAVENVFLFAQESPAWSSTGFLDVLPEQPDVWQSRVQSAVEFKAKAEMLREFGVSGLATDSDALVRPMHWYQDYLWRGRMMLFLFFGFPAITIALIMHWYARRLGSQKRPIIMTGFLITLTILVCLIAGAVDIVERGYAVRGLRLLSISIMAGAAVGLAGVLLRRVGGTAGQNRETSRNPHEQLHERTPVPV